MDLPTIAAIQESLEASNAKGIFFSGVGMSLGVVIATWHNKRYGENRRQGAWLLGGWLLFCLVVVLAFGFGY